MPTLYILHFDRPVWGKCQHYIGYTELPVEKRLAKHKKSEGSRICAHANKLGIGYHIVYTEELSTFREALKRESQVKRKGIRGGGLCPLCNKQRR